MAAVGGVGARSLLLTKSLVDMRAQLGDLQRQMATGKRSDSYAGIGIDRGLTVGLRSHLSALQSLRRQHHQCRRAAQARANGAVAHRRTRTRGEGRDRAGQHVEPANDTAARGLLARRNSRPAQYAGRRSLSVFGPCIGSAVGRVARTYSRRRRRARRPQADHLGAQSGRSRRQRPWPPGRFRAERDLGAARRGSATDRFRVQAHKHRLRIDRFDRRRSRRRAAGDVGRSRRDQSHCRRDREVHARSAGWLERDDDAHSDGLRHAGPKRIHHRRDVGPDRRQSAGRADHVARQARRHVADRGLRARGIRTTSSIPTPPTRRSAWQARPSTPRPR